MPLVRFESDDHHSQIVLGTHDIDELTPRLGDDKHVDIRVKDGRVFTVRETANQVDAKLAAHGAPHLQVKRRVFAKVSVATEPQPAEQPAVEQVNATPEAQPAAESVASQPAAAGTES